MSVVLSVEFCIVVVFPRLILFRDCRLGRIILVEYLQEIGASTFSDVPGHY